MVTIKMEAIDVHCTLHSVAPCDFNSNMTRSSKTSFINSSAAVCMCAIQVLKYNGDISWKSKLTAKVIP